MPSYVVVFKKHGENSLIRISKSRSIRYRLVAERLSKLVERTINIRYFTCKLATMLYSLRCLLQTPCQ